MRLVGPVLFVISVLAAVAFTQATVKVAVMNAYAFGDEKTGITKLVVAQKGVDAAFKRVDDGLKAMQTKLNGLTTEIDNYRKNPVGVDEKAAQELKTPKQNMKGAKKQ